MPILVVRDSTYTVAKNEAMFGEVSLEERKKIDHSIELADQTFDFEKLYKRLNLEPR